jgi:hypothetical protein
MADRAVATPIANLGARATPHEVIHAIDHASDLVEEHCAREAAHYVRTYQRDEADIAQELSDIPVRTARNQLDVCRRNAWFALSGELERAVVSLYRNYPDDYPRADADRSIWYTRSPIYLYCSNSHFNFGDRAFCIDGFRRDLRNLPCNATVTAAPAAPLHAPDGHTVIDAIAGPANAALRERDRIERENEVNRPPVEAIGGD